MRLYDSEIAPNPRRVRIVAWLDEVLADRPFVAGERFSIADITALVAVDLGTPSVFRITPDQEHLGRWHERVLSRPSARA